MTENEPTAAQPRHVVVGIDGSEQSCTALRWWRAIANATGARLDAVIAWNYNSGYGAGYLPTDVNPSDDADKVLTQTVDSVFGDARPESMRLAVPSGSGGARAARRE
jgi:hypothetical protein